MVIYLVAFYPVHPEHGGGIGFDWFHSKREALGFLSASNQEDEDLCIYVLRPIHAPHHMSDTQITAWLNTEGAKLWNPDGLELEPE